MYATINGKKYQKIPKMSATAIDEKTVKNICYETEHTTAYSGGAFNRWTGIAVLRDLHSATRPNS